MRHTLAVAARELRERFLLFPAALVIGCVPLVLPAFGVTRDAGQLVGVFCAVLLGASAAVVIGSSMLARDAATGRLGFLFSRPVSWRAIWSGKWLAALVLVFGSGLLAAVPWMAFYPAPEAFGGGSWLRTLADPSGAWMFLALAVLAIGLANFNATAFRSRSAWLVLDLLLLLAAAWAARAYVAPLLWYGFFDGFWKPQLLAASLGLALLAGSAAQVCFGRTDLRRAHRAMSLGAWSVVWLTLAIAAGTVLWVRAAGPADVQAFAVAGDPANRWVYVEGAARVPARHYPSGYLIDTGGGRYLRAPDDPAFFRTPWGVQFSADGRVAVRPGPDPAGRAAAIEVFDLAAPRPHAKLLALEKSPPLDAWWRSRFALSGDGTLVFYVHQSGASLFDVGTGRRLATVTLQPGFQPIAARFVAERSARAWLVPASEAGGSPLPEMRVVDLAPEGTSSTRSFATAAPVSGAVGTLWTDASGSRMVTLDGGLHLRDAADGRLLATLVEGPGGDTPRLPGFLAAVFLADGRIVTVDGTVPRGTKPRVSVFDAAGQKLRESVVDLRPAGLTLGPELAPGRLVVCSQPTPVVFDDAIVFDAADGRVVQRLQGLRPAVGFFTAPAVPAAAPPSTVQFFRDAQGRVLLVDTATGQRKTVAGPGAPKGERLRWQ